MVGRKLLMSPSWVKSLKPRPAPVEYRDTMRPGLVLRVEVSGLRTWATRYTFAGREKRYRIGAYPEVSLAVARSEAEKHRGTAQLGMDLQTERARVRMGETVAEVTAMWLRSEDTRNWRARSRQGFDRTGG